MPKLSGVHDDVLDDGLKREANLGRGGSSCDDCAAMLVLASALNAAEGRRAGHQNVFARGRRRGGCVPELDHAV